ncbi:hypothetical protein A3768_0628 [Ralstonia solanacearum]|nr:hypothetical protein A3768_0628 [Ralstonia solanacearum]
MGWSDYGDARKIMAASALRRITREAKPVTDSAAAKATSGKP